MGLKVHHYDFKLVNFLEWRIAVAFGEIEVDANSMV